MLFIDLCYSQTVTTLAGGSAGTIDSMGSLAQFNSPIGVGVDSSGNVYVADYFNHRIRKITTDGTVSTLAGSTIGSIDAIGTNAKFNYPTGVAIDSSGNVYVADCSNHKIRKITSGGSVTTLAGSTQGSTEGVGTNAQFNNPWGIAIDSTGNLYVADMYNFKIRKITPAGSVSTLAGSGVGGFNDAVGTNARFDLPRAVALDSGGNFYVAEENNRKIRKITPTGVVTTFAGSTQGYTDAVGTNAQFSVPIGVAVDSSGNLYVADLSNQKVRKITPSGSVTTLAGSTQGSTDAVGTNAQFNQPFGITIDTNGNLYVADLTNYKLRMIIINPISANCAAGKFLSSGQCISCSPGTYSNTTNSPNCTACPAGAFAAISGSTNCTTCPQGSFCPSAGLINVTMCPMNKYCPNTGLVLPLDCPLNSTNTRTGSVLISDCLCNSGFFKSGSICAGCPAGSYCPQNSSVPISCPIGYFCPSAMLNSPIICPQGYFCPSTGLTVATQCGANSGTTGTGSTSSANCTCNQGYTSVGGGVCTLNQVTTSISASSQIVSPTSSSSNIVSPSLASENPPQSSSILMSGKIIILSNSPIDAISSKPNSGGGSGLISAFSNFTYILIASGACLIILAAIINAVVAYRRISKAKLRRKVGITTNLTTGGVSTNGRSRVTTAEA